MDEAAARRPVTVNRRGENAARSSRLSSCAWREAAKAVGVGALWLARREALSADKKLLCTRTLQNTVHVLHLGNAKIKTADNSKPLNLGHQIRFMTIHH